MIIVFAIILLNKDEYLWAIGTCGRTERKILGILLIACIHLNFSISLKIVGQEFSRSL